MNETLRSALADGAITAACPPALVRIRLDWLESYLGEEPDLGMKFAIGTLRPVVYKLTQGEGLGPKRKVKRRYDIGDERLSLHYIAQLVTE